MKSFAASLLCVLPLLPAGLAAADTAAPVYELRIYYTHPGKMPDLLARFRDHTCKLFEKQGMVNVGYWLPVEAKDQVGSSRVDLQACKLEYSIVSPK